MHVRAYDDCFIARHSLFSENIDYMSPDEISNFHLHLCWRENNSVSVRRPQDDISLKIPSTVSRRLENIAWRRMYKQIWNLREAPPATINWNKNQDITWLFGPKYSTAGPFVDAPLTTANLSKLDQDAGLEPGHDELSSVASARLMSFSDHSLVELLLGDSDSFDAYDDCSPGLKLVLKLARRPFARPQKHRKKRVKFNYIVNSREIMNGVSFDFHFLDPLCL